MTKTQKFGRLPLADLVLPAFNPRQHEDPHLLEELAASIGQKGVLEPIIVRPKGEKYQVVAGARRFKASRIAKQRDIPAIVRELTDQEAAEFAVIENLQRADVHWLDEAKGFEKLIVDGMTADALARRWPPTARLFCCLRAQPYCQFPQRRFHQTCRKDCCNRECRIMRKC